MKFLDFYREEKDQKKPSTLLEGSKKYKFTAIHDDPDNFYNKPQMMGHHWAKETMDMLEVVANKFHSTKLQQFILKYAVTFDMKSDDDNWHYFNNWSKKAIGNLRKMLRAVAKDKKNISQHLNSLNATSAMLKTPLTHVMEWLAYKYDKENYEKSYMSTVGFYGMGPEEAKVRLEKYIKKLQKDYKFK